MAPLCGGGVASGSGATVGVAEVELRKKVPPARERAWLSERYDASL
jgi:hypothetical protein